MIVLRINPARAPDPGAKQRQPLGERTRDLDGGEYLGIGALARAKQSRAWDRIVKIDLLDVRKHVSKSFR